MDTMVLVDFGDGTYDHIHVENIFSVERPSDDQRCNVLFESTAGKRFWGYMDKQETWKIERHKDVIVDSCCFECIARDTLRRAGPASEWLKPLIWLRGK
jgi:hypothetical protein